jgi:hypothetical protein
VGGLQVKKVVDKRLRVLGKRIRKDGIAPLKERVNALEKSARNLQYGVET